MAIQRQHPTVSRLVYLRVGLLEKRVGTNLCSSELRTPANMHTDRLALYHDRCDSTFQDVQDTGSSMQVRWCARVALHTLDLTLERLGERDRDRDRE